MENIIDYSGKSPKLDRDALINNWQSIGYRIISNDKMLSDAFLVKTDGKFIERADLQYLHIEALSMTNGSSVAKNVLLEEDILSKRFFKYIPKIEVTAFKDPKDYCFMFFQNGVVRISRSGKVEIVDSGSVYTGEKKIWKTSIMKYDYDWKEDWKEGEWYRFCRNVVGEEGLPYLMRALGYLLHTYKDPACPKAIILSESHQDEGGDANGGTGKSLIATKALSVFRNVSTVDGKRWNPKDRFNFQGVNEEADIVALEDVPMRFRYDAIYNYITGDSEIERKGTTSIKVPYEQSAKFLITTNYGIALHGASDKRRRCVIGLKNYYSDTFTPLDDFGHRLFDDWDRDEWDRFFSFMIECVKIYFKEGIDNYANDGIEAVASRRFIGSDMYYYCVDNYAEFLKGMTSTDIYNKIVNDGASMGLRCDDCLKKFYMCMSMIGLERKITRSRDGAIRVRLISFAVSSQKKLDDAIRQVNPELMQEELPDPEHEEECPF